MAEGEGVDMTPRPLSVLGIEEIRADPRVSFRERCLIATIDQRDGQIVAALGLLAALLHEYDQPDTSDGPEADALWARARVLVGGGR